MSSSRKENERAKIVQEKCQTLLTLMLRDEDNKYCVDCDAKGPRWASWNLGVFLCIRCAGIHRNLGVHISRVKSVNLDSWTPEQVVSLQQMGNSRARAVYEAQLPDGFRRPQTDSALESFIRAKYEHKKYVAREWVQPPPVKVNWDKEIDEEIEKQKRKKKGLSASTTTATTNSIDSKKTAAAIKSTPLPAPLPKPTSNSHSPKISLRNSNHTSNHIEHINETNSFGSDLLGLSSPTNVPSDVKKNHVDLNTNNDVFSCFLSGPQNSTANSTDDTTKTQVQNSQQNNGNDTSATSLAQEEQDFFNQIPTEREKTKMTKDSILALYGTAPTAMGQFNSVTANQQFVSQMIPSAGGNYIGAAAGQPLQYGVGYSMPAQTQQPGVPGLMNYQQTGSGPFNSFMGFPGGVQQPFQQFVQHPNPNISSIPPSNLNVSTATSTNNPTANASINQQFGNLSLGNVWQ